MPGHVRIFFQVGDPVGWIALVKKTGRGENVGEKEVKWLRLLRPVLGDEFSRKPTYLLPAGTFKSPSCSGFPFRWDMDSGDPRGYIIIPQPSMNFTTNKLLKFSA